MAGFGRDVGADGPDDLPRFAEGRQDARRDAQLLQEFPRQAPSRTSSSPVVDALVRSAPTSPVSQ